MVALDLWGMGAERAGFATGCAAIVDIWCAPVFVDFGLNDVLIILIRQIHDLVRRTALVLNTDFCLNDYWVAREG